jgi:CheY-like chemotaxis protein
MNGLDVLKHLRDFDPRVPVIFITGGVPDAEVWEAVRDGRAYDCLRKPVTDFWKLPLLVEEARRAAREGLRSVPNVVG